MTVNLRNVRSPEESRQYFLTAAFPESRILIQTWRGFSNSHNNQAGRDFLYQKQCFANYDSRRFPGCLGLHLRTGNLAGTAAWSQALHRFPAIPDEISF